MEKMAAKAGKSAWDIAKFYQEDFERDLARLNITGKQHPRATEYVEAMIEWGKEIADKHCYELDSGLYFDVSIVADYGRLARAVTVPSILARRATSLIISGGAGWLALPLAMSLKSSFTNLLASVYSAGPVKVK